MKPARTFVLVIVVLLAPVIARADYLYTVTVTQGFFQATEFSFETTLLGAGDATSITNISGDPITEFAWNSAASGTCKVGIFFVSIGGSACAAWEDLGQVFWATSFTPGSFEALGTFISDGGDVTVNISCTDPTPNGACPISTPTPEPSSLLLLSGGALGIIGSVRRKILS